MLDPAFDRLAAFRTVQLAEHGRLTPEGVERLQRAAGLGDADREVLLARLPEVTADADPGAVLLGVLLGLFAGEPATG